MGHNSESLRKSGPSIKLVIAHPQLPDRQPTTGCARSYRRTRHSWQTVVISPICVSSLNSQSDTVTGRSSCGQPLSVFCKQRHIFSRETSANVMQHDFRHLQPYGCGDRPHRAQKHQARQGDSTKDSVRSSAHPQPQSQRGDTCRPHVAAVQLRSITLLLVRADDRPKHKILLCKGIVCWVFD